ncbi:hypothetical protein B0H34DRAFT_716892 [Crassisporium funariophilum]|nr:hypothetical protein B0H34DRAFT_716892 [Crassisporium funariophilum]
MFECRPWRCVVSLLSGKHTGNLCSALRCIILAFVQPLQVGDSEITYRRYISRLSAPVFATEHLQSYTTMASLSARLAIRTIKPTAFSRAPSGLLHSIIKRQVHNQAEDRHDRAFPFSTKNKKALAVKFLAYMGTGFAIPFIAVWWHWNRPGGLNNTHTP